MLICPNVTAFGTFIKNFKKEGIFMKLKTTKNILTINNINHVNGKLNNLKCLRADYMTMCCVAGSFA